MKRLARLALIGAVVLLLAALAFLVPTWWLKPWSIDHFYARVFLQFALRHPQMLSSMRILEPLGLQFHNDDLDDQSVEFARREARWLDHQLATLRSYDRDSLDEAGRLSFDVLEWFLADAQEGNRYLFHGYPVNQLFGIQSDLPDFMINTHRVDDLRGARQYVTRVAKFGTAFDQVLEDLRLREEMGIVPPRFVIERVLEEMRGFIAPPPADHLLYAHLRGKLAGLGEAESARGTALLARLERELTDVVYPAYRRLIDFFARQAGIATDDDGVWKLPDGEAFYAWTLRHHTTTGMSADEIHRLGLAEVAAIQAEMLEILASQGYPTDDLAATMNALNEEPRFLYSDDQEGRRRIIDDFQAIIDEIDAGMDRLFGLRPTVGVKVERVPEFKQTTAPGAYYQGAPLDRSEPGKFFINLRSVKEIPRFGMRTLAYHEAVPGHHFQGSIAQELTGVPFFRRVIPFTAYSEGWALYAERLAAEEGYQQDPFDRLGYLTGQLFRAARLVVDTGIHAQRWTRRQAIDYMLAATGMPETDVVAEIERYIVSPGQACAYKVGQLEILELRRRARERLGERFDLRAFHDVVLGSGEMPLALLGRQVDRWIEERPAGTDG